VHNAKIAPEVLEKVEELRKVDFRRVKIIATYMSIKCFITLMK